MPTVFDLAYAAALPVLAPVLLYKRLRLGKYRESLPGMLGKRLPLPLKTGADAAPRAWLHAVSVGEVVAAGAILKRLHERHPEWTYLASTTTETGQRHARQTLKLAADHFFFPLDFSWIVKRFFDAYRPSFVIIHETEIWPNFLLECRQRGIPVFLANGKLSPRSSRSYERLRAVFAGPLAAFHAFCMQTEADAERMARLGVPRNKIHVTGNCKFDAPGEPISSDQRTAERARFGWSSNERVIVVGSTHPGEEEIVLRAFREVRSEFPRARMILAPRHPERFDAVADLIGREGWSLARVSRLPPAVGEGEPPTRVLSSPAPDVVLLDAMGRLARAYGLGEVGVIGGAWNPIGGHNLLEAAVHSIPVVRGPHMHAQPEIVRILGPEQGGLCVEAGRLGEELLRLLKNDALRIDLGRKAASAVARNSGAATRTVEIILGHL